MKSALLIICIVTLAGCSVSHQTMRGTVVTVIEGETQICIGEYDGLKIGDRLTVYRTKQIGVSHLPYNPFMSPAEVLRSYNYEKVKIGTAKVIRLIDTHYAAIELVSGEMTLRDIVEKTMIPED